MFKKHYNNNILFETVIVAVIAELEVQEHQYIVHQ